MNIVVAGAGEVGFHLVKLLMIEGQNITLVDLDEDLLEAASKKLDVQIVAGDICSLNVLKNLELNRVDLFIAVTTSETTNMLSCTLAKNQGAKKTVARVNNNEYLAKKAREYFESIGVDRLFSPRNLAAKEIKRLLRRASATDIYEFEEGKISVIGFTVDAASPVAGKTFTDLYAYLPDSHFRVLVVLRGDKTIIPTMTDSIRGGDHIYLSTDVQEFDQINSLLGKNLKEIQNVMILGETYLALDVARLLEEEKNVKIISRKEAKCKAFLRKLNNTMIIHGDYSDRDLLLEESISDMDACIALTSNAESNILSCLIAEKEGVYKTIALVDNIAYTHISQKIGVDTMINKKILAANEIFRYVRKGKIQAIASLHGVTAEIIEFVIEKSNRITTCCLNELRLPDKAVIAGVVRNEEGIIPKDDFMLQKGDKVIVFALPEAVNKVEDIFK